MDRLSKPLQLFDQSPLFLLLIVVNAGIFSLFFVGLGGGQHVRVKHQHTVPHCNRCALNASPAGSYAVTLLPGTFSSCPPHERLGLGWFDFLGWNVRKYHGKLLIKPSKEAVQTFLETIRMHIKKHQQASAGRLVEILNPIIRGWANYHRHVVSKKTFSSVDHAIFQSLWHWAKRRHPNKPASWVKKKYFRTREGRDWRFFGTSPTLKGDWLTRTLEIAEHTPIRRHVKIQGKANPYDPAWEAYFEGRLTTRMKNTLTGRRMLLNLWLEQQGICPACNQPITTETEWDNHHIQWRSQGGSDKASNRVLVHPNCHRLIHSRRLSVVKPRPDKGESSA